MRAGKSGEREIDRLEGLSCLRQFGDDAGEELTGALRFRLRPGYRASRNSSPGHVMAPVVHGRNGGRCLPIATAG